MQILKAAVPLQYARHAKSENKRAIEAIVFLLALNAIWSSGTTLYHGAANTEAIISSYRLLVSSILVAIVYRHISYTQAIAVIYWIAVTNSTIVVLQLLNVLAFESGLLPSYLNYGSYIGLDDGLFRESWRQGGLLPSLQTSSFLGLVGLLIGFSYPRSKLLLITFPVLFASIIFGSRTVLILTCALSVFLIRSPKSALVLTWLPIVFILSSGHETFSAFFELRISPIFNFFDTFSLNLDYSSADTLESYRLPANAHDLFFGNNCARYSDCGGGDPFYSRWLTQAGLPSIALLTATLMIMTRLGFSKSTGLGVVGIVLLLHSIKGELATSVFVFQFYLLATLMAPIIHNNSNITTDQRAQPE